jgi:branched-chain amino acid transport system ATP-binding protein
MLLQVQGLNTYYGESHALRDFSLAIGEGEIVALLGRNGMGKSTALKSVMGLVKPRSGRVLYRGRDLAGSPPYRMARAGIGYVPEERRIFPTLSVQDNLAMGIKSGIPAATGSKTTWSLERIYAHFPFMRERASQKGRLLSGGEQQMLAIARTLMGNPEVLLVDEPTEGLAPLMVKEVRDVLAEINRAGVSIVLVEHNLKVAMSLADRVYLMGKAHVGFSGTVAELDARPEVRAQYLEV